MFESPTDGFIEALDRIELKIEGSNGRAFDGRCRSPPLGALFQMCGRFRRAHFAPVRTGRGMRLFKLLKSANCGGAEACQYAIDICFAVIIQLLREIRPPEIRPRSDRRAQVHYQAEVLHLLASHKR